MEKQRRNSSYSSRNEERETMWLLICVRVCMYILGRHADELVRDDPLIFFFLLLYHHPSFCFILSICFAKDSLLGAMNMIWRRPAKTSPGGRYRIQDSWRVSLEQQTRFSTFRSSGKLVNLIPSFLSLLPYLKSSDSPFLESSFLYILTSLSPYIFFIYSFSRSPKYHCRSIFQ